MDDPTARALAVLEPHQRKAIEALPEYEREIAEGLALWLAGHSLRRASEISGCTYGTLRNRQIKLGLTEDDRNKNLETLEPLFNAIANEAARQQLEALYEGEYKPSQLPIVMGVAADKLYKGAQLRQGQPERRDPLGDLLERAKGRITRVSLNLEYDDETIDVTPDRESNE